MATILSERHLRAVPRGANAGFPRLRRELTAAVIPPHPLLEPADRRGSDFGR
jgi:hypothetical protein